MKNLALEEIIHINDVTIKKHGGSSGIKNQSLIESALNSGLATFDGKDDIKLFITKYLKNI